MAETSYQIKSTRRSFELVEAVQRDDGLTLTELADELGLAKSAVHKHLQTLLDLGYVVREDNTYHVGLKFLGHGFHARRRTGLFEVARPEVDRLAKATGERASLFVHESTHGVYVYSRDGGSSDRSPLDERVVSDLESTAAGRAVLYNGPESVDPTPRTDASDRNSRDRDIVFSYSERSDGDQGVAAPIFDGDRPVGSIEVSGPNSRVNGKRLEEDFSGLVLSATSTVNKALQTE